MHNGASSRTFVLGALLIGLRFDPKDLHEEANSVVWSGEGGALIVAMRLHRFVDLAEVGAVVEIGW